MRKNELITAVWPGCAYARGADTSPAWEHANYSRQSRSLVLPARARSRA